MTTTWLYAVRVALAYLRWWAAEVRWAAQSVGYWVRPYDMLADQRRWRWQSAQQCGATLWLEESRIANRAGPFPHAATCRCWVCTHGGAQ